MKRNTLLVQLGCFDQPSDGWYNTDITPHILISIIPGLPKLLYMLNKLDHKRYEQHKNKVFKKVHYLDLRKKFPFKNESVDAFFSSHVFEHLYNFEFEAILNEILRSLKIGGYVRFVLPDLNYVVSLYNRENPETFLRYMYENQFPSLKKNQHRWMYTDYSLKVLLEKKGFKKVRICKYRETEFMPFMSLDNREGESFYVEAQKL